MAANTTLAGNVSVLFAGVKMSVLRESTYMSVTNISKDLEYSNHRVSKPKTWGYTFLI